MYKITEYKLARYKKALYGKSPSKYMVPTKIEKLKYYKHSNDYETTYTYQGRRECGELIHTIRAKLKNYMESLRDKEDPLYYTEMNKHKNKEGFWNPANENYTAERMVTDEKFMPNGNKWFKRSWDNDTWAKDSPIPNYGEPYWHTEHSIQKSNDWVIEHLDHMQARIGQLSDTGQVILQKQEYGVILLHLEDCLIDMSRSN